jgi:hypothetical protein
MSNFYTDKRRDLKKMKGKNICLFPSLKPTPNTIYTEGVIEKDFCYHLEVDNEVIEYESQPLGFYYWMGSERYVYTPDFQVFYKNSSIKYFEVKELKYLDDDFYEKFPIWQQQSLLLGKTLELVTDEFIYQEPLYTNLKHLSRARKNGICTEEFREIAIFALSNVESLTIRELLKYAKRPNSIGMVYKLIQLGVLKISISDDVLGPDCLLMGIKND